MQQVHISKMTGKLDGFKAISTNTITNDYCNKQHVKGKKDGKNICGDCYSHAMLNTYRKNMQASYNAIVICCRVDHLNRKRYHELLIECSGSMHMVS